MKRYVWLIELLSRNGKMIYQQIASAWKCSSLNDDMTSLSERTLYNHRQKIAMEFGVEIACDKGSNCYYIENPEVLKRNPLLGYIIANFQLEHMLLDYVDISDKILVEDVPSGRTWLKSILDAMRSNLEIEFDYRSFFGHASKVVLKPLCVKLFKRRWYVTGETPEKEIYNYGLDRIQSLLVTARTFTYPHEFSPTKYFQYFYGIYAWKNSFPEQIVIRAYDEKPDYLRSLPLHHTQKELNSTLQYTDFSLCLTPTFEFIQELFLHRDQIEVLEPESLRMQIKEFAKKIVSRYD